MPILECKNIRLLQLATEHKDVFIRLANIPEINQRVNKPPHYTNTNFLEQLEKVEKTNAYFVWMIEQNGSLIGVINSAAGRHPSIFQGGYWVNPVNWGSGAASTALNLVKNYIFDECAAQRVQAVVEPDNLASIKVLEKCGYQREGLLKKFYPSTQYGLIDVYMYAIVK